MSSRPMPKPSWNLEYLMWIFTRLSGLTLVLLAVLGISLGLLMGARNQMDLGTLMRWTFFPNPNHVLDSEIPDIYLWSNGFWQIMQILVVFFAATHGFNGLRVVVEDYTSPGFWQGTLRFLIFLLWIFCGLVGIYVILGS
ncbi:MAG: succinate dehydrogenase, hydrophobic membrane anchor protein [Anaerolineales bacterium]|jgi:succinate dehydrogenase hydrophobic anchor subunit